MNEIYIQLRHVGCYLVRFSCFPTSTTYTYTKNLVLHYKIYNETSAKTRVKIKPPLTELWLMEVQVC